MDDTPATRTGPPRSLSFVTASPSVPTCLADTEHTEFRGALEFDRKKIRRDKGKSSSEEIWTPKRGFQESSKDEIPAMDLPLHLPDSPANEASPLPSSLSRRRYSTVSSTYKIAIRRAFSVPYHPTELPSDKGKDKEEEEEDKDKDKDTSRGSAKWTKLRSLLPNIVRANQSVLPSPSVITSHTVNITDELITGGLSTLMLRLWFERDEKVRRRVPVLFHRLRIRVSDSLHPLQRHKTVFRIECEYANGAARWVIYRELRDFVSLHAHYTVSNVYNRIKQELPEFPMTSLPYLKFLKKGGVSVSRADFARMQREALENYLLNLIRTVMFHPSSNRLVGFFEISALFIALAQSGGAQSKAGYLRVVSTAGGFGRRSASLKAQKEVWCAVRESYLVVLEEPGELDVWDVFLFDRDFKIERPKRYYRTLLHYQKQDDDRLFSDQPQTSQLEIQISSHPEKKLVSSIRNSVSKIFHPDPPSNVHEHEDDSRSESASSVVSSIPPRVPTPMLDPSTNKNPLQQDGYEEHGENKDSAPKKHATVPSNVSKHTFYVLNSQMRLKLSAKNERQMMQFITALEKTAAACNYFKLNRFDSFAPNRLNVAAQWLVDGRDYFWNLSRAILLAKESIYIHGWWLSPELEMRRPNKERYRLDKLLERKAKEGVKIYVIIYLEVSNRTTPVDSNYTKRRLVGLHHNVMVQRSPSHFQTGTFYWAHHEKMCVIDQTIAFMGGLDLCFGRWDTPQHVMTDDTAGTDRAKIWPGKDYSNPRISDFSNLNKPEEDMYDRTRVPRMPWHDVGIQIIGQPARDLAHHFVQRWNYLLRIKNHTRVMPFLLPPPEFRPGELAHLLTGTCELQICRSAGPWSLGTPGKIEHSIQNAYLKVIEMSEHFVYIENQFFITSTVVNDVKVENRIGDAIVHRIIRAHRNKTPWKCCIMIPLLPGFTFPVDHADASAIRIILECQNRTIARGPNSIFSRLRKEGIDPDEYISVFSLRNWAKMRGDVLTTEQVYIHGKICIVDDRWAIIGSANINERSQRGDRDSELAAIIKDTDLIDGTMAGRPFKVGRFAHSLRVRLMREHLGIDVDALSEEDLMTRHPSKSEYQQQSWVPDPEPEPEQEDGNQGGVFPLKQKTPFGVVPATMAGEEPTSAETGKIFRRKNLSHGTAAPSVGNRTLDEERKDFNEKGQKITGFASSVVPTLEEKTILEKTHPKYQTDDGKDEALKDQTIMESGFVQAGRIEPVNGGPDEPSAVDNVPLGALANHKSPSLRGDVDSEECATASARVTNSANIGSRSGRKPWTVPTIKPKVEPHDFEDPILDAFWKNVWVASAVHNTEIYRKVFHAIPDDLITTWKQYREFVMYHERLNKPTRDSLSPEPVSPNTSESGEERATHESLSTDPHDTNKGIANSPLQNSDSEFHSHQRSSKGSEPFEKWEREEMEKLLSQLNGRLVVYPNRFLEGEDFANNFLFNADRLLPLPIYD